MTIMSEMAISSINARDLEQLSDDATRALDCDIIELLRSAADEKARALSNSGLTRHKADTPYAAR